jgi:hypothetical protein
LRRWRYWRVGVGTSATGRGGISRTVGIVVAGDAGANGVAVVIVSVESRATAEKFSEFCFTVFSSWLE